MSERNREVAPLSYWHEMDREKAEKEALWAGITAHVKAEVARQLALPPPNRRRHGDV